MGNVVAYNEVDGMFCLFVDLVFMHSSLLYQNLEI